MLKIDHTKRTDWNSCPRKYQLKWLRHILPVKGSTALRYGIGWHGCMEGYYGHIGEHGWTRDGGAMTAAITKGQEEFWRDSEKFEFRDDYRTVENMMQSFVAYTDHFAHDEGMLEIISTEKVFMIRITPTKVETELFPAVNSFYFTGRMDNEILLNGRPWLLEHKTTGQALSLQASRLHRSPQVLGYNYAARAILEEVPDGSLIVLHQLTAYKSKKTGQYGNPKIDFQRVPMIFSDDDLANFRVSLVRDAWDIQFSNFFPMRHSSCYTYGPCAYINLCEQNRPEGEEVMEGFFVDEDPWDVTKDKEHITEIVEEDNDIWEESQRKILSLT